MNRRGFLSRVSLAAGLETANSGETLGNAHREIQDQHTCITCAVGLEVMLRGLIGVTKANASYPESDGVIAFDEHITNKKTLKAFITCGFLVA